MLKIRLQRVGRKHDPSFRIVLTDSKNGPKSGKFIEILGNYDAKKDVKVVDGERVKELMATGAQVSDTVYNILVDQKVLEGKKKNVLPKKAPIVSEQPEEEKSVEKTPEETTDETSTEANTEEVKEEISAEEEKPADEEKPAEEAPAKADETPAEEVKEEISAEEEKPTEEEPKEEEPKEEKEA